MKLAQRPALKFEVFTVRGSGLLWSCHRVNNKCQAVRAKGRTSGRNSSRSRSPLPLPLSQHFPPKASCCCNFLSGLPCCPPQCDSDNCCCSCCALRLRLLVESDCFPGSSGFHVGCSWGGRRGSRFSRCCGGLSGVRFCCFSEGALLSVFTAAFRPAAGKCNFPVM